MTFIDHILSEEQRELLCEVNQCIWVGHYVVRPASLTNQCWVMLYRAGTSCKVNKGFPDKYDLSPNH